MIDLPKFKYHPDPLATGSVVPSDEACQCCGNARGYVYYTSPYGRAELEFVCPWCIADGTANSMFGASFADSWPLSQAKISQEIIDEVCLRTPGYESWQQEDWIACCKDACEFHGDAEASELAALGTDDRMRIAEEMGWTLEGFDDVLKNYVPKGDPAIYLFRCRHCRAVHCNYDCS